MVYYFLYEDVRANALWRIVYYFLYEDVRDNDLFTFV